ncbi:integrase_H2C2 domain-containing protein [Trichonephila clavipes]|nr:integrase_H2C2 domain-containing protein [Trichonephila clavipes]
MQENLPILLFSYELILEALYTYNWYRVNLGLHHVGEKETKLPDWNLVLLYLLVFLQLFRKSFQQCLFLDRLYYSISLVEERRTLGVFVYNRVLEIRKLTPVKAWRHVPGSLNSADCPSRGCSAKQLCCLKWWEGPSWLHLSPQE